MPQLRRSLEGILVWACPSVRPSVHYTCTLSRTVRDRTLKFGMWVEYENYGDPYFFFLSIRFVIAELLPFSKFFITL